MVEADGLVGPIEVTAVAHGGHMVGRYEGRVFFIRHAIPGETVMVKVTDDSKARFWRADTELVLEASPHRVSPSCPVATLCGGCDFQHIELKHQRELKRQVIAEQLSRLAGVDWSGEVVAVAPDLGWRTRMKYWVDGEAIGLRQNRSHQVVDLVDSGCLLADPAGPQVADLIEIPDVLEVSEIQVICAASGVSVLVDGKVNQGEQIVREKAGELSYRVSANGFWQIHPEAAKTLVETVLGGLQVQPGEEALDLYCGVGLFAKALVSQGARVVGVEVFKPAVALARENVPSGRFIAGGVEKSVSKLKRADVIVLDPPRTGAGTQVCRKLASLGARAVAYVACDPAALARDLKTWLSAGYQIESIQAFDLFPMTHHVETVALLSKIEID